MIVCHNCNLPFEIDPTQLSELETLCKKYKVLEPKLFGSAARDDFNPTTSDLDFLVTFADPPEGMRLGTQFFGFSGRPGEPV